MKEQCNWNPRVVLWARAHGIELTDLVREINEDLYCPGDDTLPWTILFLEWMGQQWMDFYRMCHGTPKMGECCSGLDTQQRFNEWLEARVETRLGRGGESD